MTAQERLDRMRRDGEKAGGRYLNQGTDQGTKTTAGGQSATGKTTQAADRWVQKTAGTARSVFPQKKESRTPAPVESRPGGDAAQSAAVQAGTAGTLTAQDRLDRMRRDGERAERNDQTWRPSQSGQSADQAAQAQKVQRAVQTVGRLAQGLTGQVQGVFPREEAGKAAALERKNRALLEEIQAKSGVMGYAGDGSAALAQQAELEKKLEEYRTNDAAIQQLKQAQAQAEYLEKMGKYFALQENEDFAEKSRYQSTYKPGTEKFNAFSGTYSNSGFGDIAYDYINGDQIARDRQGLADVQNKAALLGLDNSERLEMTDDEIAIFNYIYATQSPEAAYQYISDLTSELNFRQRQAAQEEWGKYASEHPVSASVFSVLESPMKGLSYLGQAADYFSDGEIDQNAGYNKFSYIPSAIRGQVAQDIEEKVEGFWGKAGSFAYQTGMSMGDFLLNTGITGGNQALSLAIMGTGAAADTTISAKDRGLSDGQAFALGTIAGLAEVVTEKVSLEALLKPDWEKGVLNYIIKNAVAEGSEEVGSDLINGFSDLLIAQDKAELVQNVKQYQEQGDSDGMALFHALMDSGGEVLLDLLGGALSGGIMSGVAGAGHVVTNYQSGRKLNTMDLSVGDIQTFIDEGLASDPSTQAYQLAKQAQQKLAAGKTLTTYELGNLYQANVRAVGMEEDGAALLEQAAREMVGQEELLGEKTASTGEAVKADMSRFDGGILSNLNKAREYFVTYARNHFPSAVINEETGKEIGISRRGIDKFLSGRIAREKYASGFHIPELIERAHKVGEADNYHADTVESIPTYEYYDSPIEIDGRLYQAHIRVKNTLVGDKYYGHTISEVEDIKIEPSARTSVSESPTVQPVHAIDDSTFNSMIPQAGDEVKGQFMQQGGEISPEQKTAEQQAYDMARLRKAAKSLGKQGAKAAQEFYQGSTLSPEAYFGGFAAYYQAGIMGMDMGKVQSRYAGALNDAQKQAAYLAGQVDAAASLAAEKAAAPYAKTAGKDSGLVYDAYVRDHMEKKEAERLNRVAKALGVRVRFVDQVDGGIANASIQGPEVLVEKNNPNPVGFLLGHEFTHRLQELAPEAYRTFRNTVAEEVQGEVRALQELYAGKNVKLTYEQALDEATANYAGRMLEDGKLLDDFIEKHHNDRTMLEKLRDAIRVLIDKLTGRERKMAQTAEGKLTAALEAAAEQAKTLKTEERSRQADGGVRYSLNENFAKELDEWDGKTERTFQVGTTSEALRSIGAEERNIVWHSRKINQIMRKHKGMTLDIIKQVPQILENPIAVLKSQQSESRLALFGEIYDADGAPVTAILELQPTNQGGRLLDMNVVASAYGKDSSPARFVENSELLYLDPNKNRTKKWMQGLGLQLPSGTTTFGSIGTVSYQDGIVKIEGVPYHQYIQGSGKETAAQESGEVRFSIKEDSDGQMLTSEHPDIRFSLKGSETARDTAKLQEENSLLQERLSEYQGIAQEAKRQKGRADYWKSQTRRTKQATTDAKAVKAAAQALIRETSSSAALQDIQGELQSLYDYIAGGDEVTGSEVWKRAREIAGTLVENASTVDSEYDELLSYLRTTQLNLGREFNDIEDFGDFRRRYFGRLRIGTKGTNIDQVYLELSERWPEFFDEVEQSHPSDQLKHIAEVVDQIIESRESNPYSSYMEQAIDGTANEIIEQFFDLPQTKATMADRWAAMVDAAKANGRQQVQKARDQKNAQIEALRKENRQRVQKAIERERAASERRLDAVKDRYAAKDQKGQERRSAAELRRKITKHSKALSDKLLRPTDKKHIPEEMRGAVAAVLEAINQESQYTVDPETGKRAKNQEGAPVKRTEAFRTLREQYEAISNGRTDFMGVLDPDLLDNLAEVIAMRDVPIAAMTSTQLATVWKVVRAVEQSVSTANKLLGRSRFEGVTELAEGIRASSASRRTKRNYSEKGLFGPAAKNIDSLLNLDMMTPVTFFHQFGEGGDALFHELQEARDQKTRILAETTDQVQRVIGKTDISKLREETHTFQVEGGEITLTTAQIMSLYELSKREQAQDHIYKGGLRASPIETSAALLGRIDAPAAGVRVSLDDVANILSTLTDEQVKIADGLQGIMQDYLAREGNRESRKVYGYEKFGEENYFPISSDPHQVQDKIGDVLEGGQKRPRSIAEWGSAKATVERANNGLLLGDIFDVFAQHAVDMATYASHLGAMEDLNRVRNFTFRDGEGTRIGTMGDIIQRVTGLGGGDYLNKLLQDVSAGTAKNSVTGLGKLTANYKAASVGANIRVALQQPTAYLRAAAVMDAKYLMDPRILKKGGWAKAMKYAPIAQWKDWGNFEINQGRQLQNIMFNTDNKLEKVRNASMWLAGEMDSVTWGRIWNACELETLDKRPDLAQGSAEFNEAVARRFTDIIDQTQVVDNVLGRSQIMRSSDNLSKMATSYMGEPTQSYNLVYRALRDISQEQDNAKRTAARKVLGRAVVALAASQFVNAIAQALWDAVRDDDDRDKKYWERVLGHISENFVDNIDPTGMVPYFKDIKSLLQGYDIKRMDTEAIASFISACQNMGKAINGEGRYTLAGASANLIAEAARLFGLAAATVKRDLAALARTVAVETGDWYFQYQLEKALNSVGYSGNRGEFYDIAWGALKDGEMDVYQTITQDLMTQGVKASAIEGAMRERLKKAQEEEASFVLSQQARDLIGSRDSYGAKEQESDGGGFTAADLDPEEYQRFNTQRAESYREVVNDLEGFSTFKGLDGETKDKALAAADTLTEKLALEAASGGAYTVDTKWMLWASGGESAGVSEAEAILFKAAYDMTSGDVDEHGKTISGSRKENVLEAAEDMMPWLTDQELAYLMSNFWKG